jgi:hypothetical protein
MSAQFRLELWKVNLLDFIALTQFFDSVNEAFMEINGFSLVKNFNTHFVESCSRNVYNVLCEY